METKVCRRCGAEKQHDQFYRADKTCKECRKRLVRENRASKVDYYRQYESWRYANDPRKLASLKKYANTKKGREAAARAKKKWIAENPEKRSAHTALSNAIRAGRVIKPKACSVCGREPSRLHGHHMDYSRPLDVMWLCGRCHKKEHEKLKE